MTVRPAEVHRLLDRCMLADRARLRRRLRGLDRRGAHGPQRERILADILEQAERSAAVREERASLVPAVEYPDDLPVSARRRDIADALREHQCVVVCGETGSGKTTQLPKICVDPELGLGRGVAGLIGHTQPRRIAARTVAGRIAEELGTQPGDLVGSKVRFGDETSGRTLIKLMTDGILLAETQGDRLLHRYDTIIIDEAHERSLNIDFLLGYLADIRRKRPDLKIVITSATIDPQRFADHFAEPDGRPAPIIEVSGRTYPVEVRYRPLLDHARGDSAQRGDGDAIGGVVDAVREIELESPGDVLVFMPGEREIRETANALRRHYGDAHPLHGAVEILPLYARLGIEEQRRVFRPHKGRRIVIATNVAETSLTVPGIRYVVDPGTARISRYSARSKIQHLDVEPISRASADQRKGRCGRTGPGVCYRLFSEEDYAARDPFTQPEILRTNLASVVLQMAALRLGRPERFPFVEPPDNRLIRDGYETLTELGAVDERGELTDTGRDIARLPIDPRVGRMLLAARDEHCLSEVLVIAAGLSIQDPRDRPPDRQDEADRAHERFRHETSDFMSLLNIWHFFHDSIRPLSRSRRKKACAENFLSERRMHEWMEVVGQLRSLLVEMKLPMNPRPAAEDAIHRALLTGLLTNIGRLDEKAEYAGCRGQKFYIHPGSAQFTKKPKWLMAAELVRTTKLYARCVARIDPGWVESLGAHMLKRSYAEPHWDADRAEVMAYEKVTLAGLEIVKKRKARYGPVEPRISREIFIDRGLVEGEYDADIAALRHNRELERSIETLEEKARRRDLLAEAEARFRFYDERLPPDAWSGGRFEAWMRREERRDPRALFMSLGDLLLEDADTVSADAYPDEHPDFGMRLEYAFAPGEAHDGVTVDIPISRLGQMTTDKADRLVPGLLAEKIEALMRALPKAHRRNFDIKPLARELAGRLAGPDGSLVQSLAEALSNRAGVRIGADMFPVEQLPDHLRMRFRVLDADGNELAVGRDLAALQQALGEQIREGFREATAGAAGAWHRDGLTDWDFGDLPAFVEIDTGPAPVRGYPALADVGGSAALRLFDSEPAARASMRRGLARLFARRLKGDLKFEVRTLPELNRLVMYFAPLGDAKTLRAELTLLLADRVFVGDEGEVRTYEGFVARLDRGWDLLRPTLDEVVPLVEQTLGRVSAVAARLGEDPPAAWRPAYVDMREQLARLTGAGFLTETPYRWLRCYPRFLRAMEVRLERLRGGGESKDQPKLVEARRWERAYFERLAGHAAGGVVDPELAEFRWLIEELRVSLFAQELKTSVPVSPKRLERAWERVRP